MKKFRVIDTATGKDAGKNFAIIPSGELIMRVLDFTWYPVAPGHFRVEWEPEPPVMPVEYVLDTTATPLPVTTTGKLP